MIRKLNNEKLKIAGGISDYYTPRSDSDDKAMRIIQVPRYYQDGRKEMVYYVAYVPTTKGHGGYTHEMLYGEGSKEFNNVRDAALYAASGVAQPAVPNKIYITQSNTDGSDSLIPMYDVHMPSTPQA